MIKSLSIPSGFFAEFASGVWSRRRVSDWRNGAELGVAVVLDRGMYLCSVAEHAAPDALLGQQTGSRSIRESMEIDWRYREGMRVKIRVLLMRILYKYGYPHLVMCGNSLEWFRPHSAGRVLPTPEF